MVCHLFALGMLYEHFNVVQFTIILCHLLQIELITYIYDYVVRSKNSNYFHYVKRKRFKFCSFLKQVHYFFYNL